MLLTVGSVPALFSGPKELACDGCAANLLLVERDETPASAFGALQTVLYVVLLFAVLVALAPRWRRADRVDRLQRTPVYACALLAFLLVTVGGRDAAARSRAAARGRTRGPRPCSTARGPSCGSVSPSIPPS